MNDIFRELYFDQRKNFEIVEQLKKLVVIYENLSEPTKGTDDYKQGTQDMLEKVIEDIKKIIGENNE